MASKVVEQANVKPAGDVPTTKTNEVDRGRRWDRAEDLGGKAAPVVGATRMRKEGVDVRGALRWGGGGEF